MGLWGSGRERQTRSRDDRSFGATIGSAPERQQVQSQHGAGDQTGARRVLHVEKQNGVRSPATGQRAEQELNLAAAAEKPVASNWRRTKRAMPLRVHRPNA